jgi:hypothetical protein
MGQHDCLEEIPDASPWNIKGILFIDESAISWFVVEISVEDVAIFGQAIGDPAGQQIWECFAAYLALRLW